MSTLHHTQSGQIKCGFIRETTSQFCKVSLQCKCLYSFVKKCIKNVTCASRKMKYICSLCLTTANVLPHQIVCTLVLLFCIKFWPIKRNDKVKEFSFFCRAAFQFGIKMSEGRKTRRAGPKDEKAKLDRDWQKISQVGTGDSCKMDNVFY